MKVHGPRVSNPQPSAAAAVCVARWGRGACVLSVCSRGLRCPLFSHRKPTSTASTSSLSGQPRTSRRATKTSERCVPSPPPQAPAPPWCSLCRPAGGAPPGLTLLDGYRPPRQAQGPAVIERRWLTTLHRSDLGLGCSPQGLTPSPGLRVPLGKPRALCLGPPQLTVSGPCLLSMVPWFGLTWDRPGPPPPWCCWGRQPGQAALTQAQRGAALGCRFPGSICGTAEERSPGREVPPVCLLAGFTPPLVWLGHQAACSGCGGDGARSSSPAGGVRAVSGGPEGRTCLCPCPPGHQEQRGLPGVGALLPGDVLLLAALPRLVRQLAAPPASGSSGPLSPEPRGGRGAPRR